MWVRVRVRVSFDQESLFFLSNRCLGGYLQFVDAPKCGHERTGLFTGYRIDTFLDGLPSRLCLLGSVFSALSSRLCLLGSVISALSYRLHLDSVLSALSCRLYLLDSVYSALSTRLRLAFDF